MGSIRRPLYSESTSTALRPLALNHSAFYDEKRDSEFVLEPEGGSIFQHFRVLRRRAFLLVAMAASAGLIGYLISLPQTPLYRARTSLEIAGTNWPGVVTGSEQGPTPDSGLDDTYLQTQIKVLQSESMAERVVAKLKLEDRSELLGATGIVSKMRERYGPPLPETNPHDRALRQVVDNLKVRPAGQTRVIEILYDCSNPQLAASVANAVVDEYIVRFLELRGSSNQSTTEWLTAQLEELRGKLERSQLDLQAYAREAGLIIFTPDRPSLAEDSLKRLKDDLSRAALERIAKQSENEVANSYPYESLPEVLENPVLQEYRIKMGVLQRELAGLSASFTPTHYKVRRVEAEIAELQTLMTTERDNILKRITNGFASARRRETLLTDEYSQETKRFSELAERGIRYEMLKHEADTNRQLFDSMLQKVKEARIASALRASNIRMLDRAKPPVRPYAPDKQASTAIGLLAGLSFGMLFVISRDRSDRTLKSPGDIAMQLGIRELGAIPSARVDPEVGRARRRVRQKMSIGLSSALVHSQPIPELVTLQRQSSVMAECFRAVLASILFNHRKGQHPRVIVITSPGPSEGKTVTASNLAIALAEIRQRVVLIDADMRRTRLPAVFNVPNTWGLSNILSDQNHIQNCPIEALTRESEIPGLHLVPSGPSVLNTSRLLYSARLKSLLQRLRQDFDIIMIDTPPMIQFPDVRVLGQLADGVVMVVRAGQTTSDRALTARRRLSEDMIPIIGAILNDWDPSTGVPLSTYHPYEPKTYDLQI
jgi:succinoglycan biosynthesis transport protein ExoP